MEADSIDKMWVEKSLHFITFGNFEIQHILKVEVFKLGQLVTYWSMTLPEPLHPHISFSINGALEIIIFFFVGYIFSNLNIALPF